MKSKKQRLMLTTAILLVAGGLWLTATNGWIFLKGYNLGGGAEQVEVSAESNKVVEEKKIAASEVLYPVRPEIGDEIGELSIPKLKAVLPIFHGTDEDELAKGVGHFADSVLPGEKDNSVLSGHRDTVFRKLGEVGVGDELIVTTEAGEFTYKVRKVRIVDADDRTVIVPKPRATLTVSTCYPFDFVGSAPERYILEAYLVK
uniref:class D sortase n=1 Tax=Oceanobacillus picturae TaxID=171693 RepID=UPI0036F349A6